MIKQLSLFDKLPDPGLCRIRYYQDLSIHEKINVKCNVGRPFAINWLRAGLGRHRSPVRHDDHPEQIQERQYRWDMMHNHGGIVRQTKKEVRDAMLRKEKLKSLMFRYS